MNINLIAAFPVTNVPRSDANGGDFAIVVFVLTILIIVVSVIYQWWKVNK